VSDWIIKMDEEGSLWYKGERYVKEKVSPLASPLPKESVVLEGGSLPCTHKYSYVVRNGVVVRHVCDWCGHIIVVDVDDDFFCKECDPSRSDC